MNYSVLIITIILTLIGTTLFLIVLNVKNANKHLKNLNFKAIAFQLLAMTSWVAILGGLLSDSENIAGNDLVLFITSVFIGAFLIRSIFRELKNQDEIDSLINKIYKKNDKLRVLDKRKTEFVSLASHQMRGPLSSIQGYTSMLLENDFGEVPEKMKEPLERIMKSTNSLGYLLNDFLNVSKIEKGEMQYDFQKHNLNNILNEIVNRFEPEIDKRGLELDFEFDNTNNIFIQADKDKITQVFSNLLENAIKYTQKGSIYIHTELIDNDKIKINFRDTGMGILKDTQEKLFEKFVRSERAIKADVSGSGLGLYVAKTIVKDHGGSISVESEGIDKGSNFIVILNTDRSIEKTN